jgi:hypothetical protein
MPSKCVEFRHKHVKIYKFIDEGDIDGGTDCKGNRDIRLREFQDVRRCFLVEGPVLIDCIGRSWVGKLRYLGEATIPAADV